MSTHIKDNLIRRQRYHAIRSLGIPRKYALVIRDWHFSRIPKIFDDYQQYGLDYVLKQLSNEP